MSTITKERVANLLQFNSEGSDCQANAEQWEVHELARIVLASLEAEAVGEVVLGEFDDCGCHPDARVACIAADGQADWENFKDGTRLYTAPPAPVSAPAAMEMDDDFDSAFEHGKAVGWNAYRAAMLQGADRPQNEPQNIPENIPATQFKPVADLYGLTSPTGGETSFTFDAVEARDFIDGGWSCQDYVELERFQEAVSGNSPVIPDGWVIVPAEPTAEMLQSGISAHYERNQIQIHDRPAPGPMECAYVAMLAAAPQQEAE
ncbi:hypothetical protein SR99_22260 [Enterobacter hormaechei subsp. steigerwaltii]|uniref:hypothetical protein n=1 Tax=Enterobacter hormaechei TaxID=158836 RepID=UPI0005EE8D23|nr:hypothetical protein [Enterobacter hormaechei]KJO55630.1 hypothetical protein SR99_22260 [Enterobacter hormaechei subsp. steigerwaltii]